MCVARPCQERAWNGRVKIAGLVSADYGACTAAATPQAPHLQRAGPCFSRAHGGSRLRRATATSLRRAQGCFAVLHRHVVLASRARVGPWQAASNRFDRVRPEVCGLAAAHLRHAF